jgi:hypothetical protein
MVSGKPVLDPLLDPGAPDREWDAITLMADKRVDVCLRRGDAALLGDEHCLR